MCINQYIIHKHTYILIYSYICVYLYMYIYICLFFKELAHMFVGSGKLEICRAGQQAGNSVKNL